MVPMRLIVGLGNPESKYRHTPHNMGFQVTDLLATRHGGQWRSSRAFHASLANVTIADHELSLMQPMTYMNLSGGAVASFARRRLVEPGEILVICDDAALPLGRVRLRQRGSAGGHKGLLSIVERLGTIEFSRLRIGIATDAVGDEDLSDYVLRPWRGELRKAMEAMCEHAADAVERILSVGEAKAMTELNGQKFLEWGGL